MGEMGEGDINLVKTDTQTCLAWPWSISTLAGKLAKYFFEN